jgi:hypothetical protein
MNLNDMQNNNIKLYLNPGLTNDFNSFNLNKGAIDDFDLSIYLGDEYVKNVQE